MLRLLLIASLLLSNVGSASQGDRRLQVGAGSSPITKMGSLEWAPKDIINAGALLAGPSSKLSHAPLSPEQPTKRKPPSKASRPSAARSTGQKGKLSLPALVIEKNPNMTIKGDVSENELNEPRKSSTTSVGKGTTNKRASATPRKAPPRSGTVKKPAKAVAAAADSSLPHLTPALRRRSSVLVKPAKAALNKSNARGNASKRPTGSEDADKRHEKSDAKLEQRSASVDIKPAVPLRGNKQAQPARKSLARKQIKAAEKLLLGKVKTSEPLHFYIHLPAEQWSDHQNLRFTIAALHQIVKTENISASEIADLAYQIHTAIRTWSMACNRSDTNYVGVFHQSSTCTRLAFRGPIHGISRYIREHLESPISSHWKLDNTYSHAFVKYSGHLEYIKVGNLYTKEFNFAEVCFSFENGKKEWTINTLSKQFEVKVRSPKQSSEDKPSR